MIPPMFPNDVQVRKHTIKTMDISSLCESKRPGIYYLTSALLEAVDTTIRPA